MIEMYTGLPGAGKSYGALLRIMDVLERTNQVVVTNCALRLDVLNEYYNRRASSVGRLVDVFSRVRLINSTEAREFWRFRPSFSVIPDVTLKRRRKASELTEIASGDGIGDRPNTAQVVDVVTDMLNEAGHRQPGVFYVIEEAHLLFDARSWASTAQTLTFYNSQHRKFLDDCVFVTQFLKLIELRVRGFAENFYVYRNFAGRKVYQFLRMPSRLRELKFPVDPSVPGAQHDSETWRALDLEKAACYSSMSGVGVGGAGSVEVRSVKGFSLPWWSPFVALAALALLFVVGSKLALSKFGESFVKTVSPATSSDPVSRQKSPRGEVKHDLVKPPPVPPAAPAAVSRPAGALPGAEWPTVRSTAVRADGRMVVTLSTGIILREADILLIDDSKIVTRGGQTFYKSRDQAPLNLSRIAGRRN